MAYATADALASDILAQWNANFPDQNALTIGQMFTKLGTAITVLATSQSNELLNSGNLVNKINSVTTATFTGASKTVTGADAVTTTQALNNLNAFAISGSGTAIIGAVEAVTKIDGTNLQGAIGSIITVAAGAGVGLADQQANLAFTAFGAQVQTLAISADAITGVTGTIGSGGHIDRLVLVHDGSTLRDVDTSIPTLTAAFVAGTSNNVIGAINELINTAIGINAGAPSLDGGINVEFLFS